MRVHVSRIGSWGLFKQWDVAFKGFLGVRACGQGTGVGLFLVKDPTHPVSAWSWAGPVCAHGHPKGGHPLSVCWRQ